MNLVAYELYLTREKLREIIFIVPSKMFRTNKSLSKYELTDGCQELEIFSRPQT